MILDFETYFSYGTTLDQFVQLLDEGGVDKAVAFPPTPTTVMLVDNRLHAERLAGCERLIGGCLINPKQGEAGVRELEMAVKDWGFKTLKLMPPIQGFDCDSEVPIPLMRKADELGITVTIHSGAEAGCDPLQIGVLAEQFPKVPIIMDHMGYRSRVSAAIAVAKRLDNVYLGTTRVIEPYWVKEAVRVAGPEKVVFGSNLVTGHGLGLPQIHILIIRKAGLKKEEEELVLGKNLARLLKIQG